MVCLPVDSRHSVTVSSYSGWISVAIMPERAGYFSINKIVDDTPNYEWTEREAQWYFESLPLHRFKAVLPFWSLILPVTVISLTAVTRRTCFAPWRFSLRTLLVATTVVAVVLGLVVWAGR
jgi:hypothetical protein